MLGTPSLQHPAPLGGGEMQTPRVGVCGPQHSRGGGQAQYALEHTPLLQSLGLQQVALVPVPQGVWPVGQQCPLAHWPLLQQVAVVPVPQQVLPGLQHWSLQPTLCAVCASSRAPLKQQRWSKQLLGLQHSPPQQYSPVAQHM